MIEFVSGDFFEFDADILVNTVNCVGVMGAGVALAFKKRYPEMFDDYVEKCRSGSIRPGAPSVWIQRDMISKEIEIVNFPTKDHWRKPSEYQYIDDGLKWLSTYLEDKPGKIVTLPALGCGHGQLDWAKVSSMISLRLQDSPAHIYVFEPADSLNVAQKKYKFDDCEPLLRSVGIKVIKTTSFEYPLNLKKYTSKDLFFYPIEKESVQYDYSLICSSKPTDEEILSIRKFIESCLQGKRSVLFGATAFEKKLAFEFAEQGLVCGCGLPSGIYESAKKLSRTRMDLKPNLVSIGNPTVEFDKKEFMPSVMMRTYLAGKIIFFASKLTWLSKYKKHFSKMPIESYYFISPDSSSEDIEAVANIGAEKVDMRTQLWKDKLELKG